METYPHSFWADLYTSFPLLARELEGQDLTGATACVLGCSDGKFVIPLVAAGVQVTAVDVDPVMLKGGTVTRGETAEEVRGLRRNLAEEGLVERCEIVEADFMDWQSDSVFDITLTSGSWAYNRNLHHGLGGVIGRMQRLVSPAGYLFADFLLPHTDAERKIDLYPEPAELATLFPPEEWRTVHNEEVGLIGESHYGMEEWHVHRYGALLVERRR